MKFREFKFGNSRIIIHANSNQEDFTWKFSVSFLREGKSVKFGFGMSPKEAIAGCRKHISLGVTDKIKGDSLWGL